MKGLFSDLLKIMPRLGHKEFKIQIQMMGTSEIDVMNVEVLLFIGLKEDVFNRNMR